MSIVVSVAAYRDPELVPTVLDCLAKAERPDELRIVVNWQHTADEDVSALHGDSRIELLDFDARESRGACWARAKIQKRCLGHDWYFQVDSHTRFASGWDARLIAMAAHTGADKPILTCYPPCYEPATQPSAADEPTALVLHGWTADGLPILSQTVIPDWREATRPVRARFVAGGFLFAPGAFVRDVPYDDGIYFLGEEINLATRAFTNGYELFHPVEVLAWHYYTRQDQPHHWDDHNTDESAWYRLDRASRRRVRTLLLWPMIGDTALGGVRTLADYERYAGVDFAARTATGDATLGTEPAAPTPLGTASATTAV